MTYQITTTLIGLAMASAILYLVRRDHLHGPYAFWWLIVAISTVVLGFQPELFDRMARAVGVTYPPTLLFALVIGLMLIKMLKGDIERSRHERKIRRLAQQMAILAEDHRELQQKLAELTPPVERPTGRTASR